jgi:hypothetical protein
LESNQATTDVNVKGMKAKMDVHEEKMEAAIHFTWVELEIVKYRVEDILSCVHQKTQGLHKENTDKTQVGLQAVKGDITDTRIFSRP